MLKLHLQRIYRFNFRLPRTYSIINPASMCLSNGRSKLDLVILQKRPPSMERLESKSLIKICRRLYIQEQVKLSAHHEIWKAVL